MKNILLQDKLSKEDKIQFYNQQLFDKARPLKKAICLLVSIIFVYDFIETQFIFPEEFTASARSFTKYTTIFGLVLTFITYYISIFKFFERKDQKIFKVRYLLMLMTVIFYAGSQSLDAYYKLIDRNASQDNQKWIYTLMRSYNQIWVILLTDILIPVWYLKLVIASFYWVALLVFYYQTGYQYVSMIWSAAVSSIIFAASIWGIKAYNDWKNFVYKSNTEAWNGVHKYILDKVPDAIAIVDQKISVIYSNSNFESLCGNDISQLSQRLSNIKEIEIKPIEIKPIEYDLKQTRIKSNDEYHLISREERTTSQTFMTFSNLIENVISCRRKDNTNPDGYAVFNASLAPQEATQTSVRRSYEIKVGRLNEYGKVILILNDTTQRDLAISLETANHYKDKLLATVSHDLRAPIMGGLTFIENAIQNPKVSRDVKETSLIPAQKSCKFLLHLVNDILDFSQINAKKLRMSFEKLSIIETIRNCYQLVEMQAIHKGIGFTLELGYNIPDKFTTDHNRLSQIIINLLTNAIKFTFNGEIKLSINAIKESLIEIKVSDTGIGIKEEDQSKLFQEFARINYDQNNINPRGIGLGLVIANKLAKKLGVKGKKKGIDVISKYGEGTTFSFIIIDKDAESPIVFRSPNHEVMKSEVEAFSIRVNIPEKEEDFLYEKIDESNLLFNQSSIQSPYAPEFFKRRLEQRLTFPFSSVRTVLTTCGEKKSRGKVLIVDDDPLNVLALESIFNQHQILTDAAFSGKQAIDKITQAETMHKEWEGTSIEVLKSGFNSPSSNLHHPDDYRLILMDYEMPNMNGLETCQKLIAMMKNGEIRQMPIVGCSGHIGKEFIEKCQENGMAEVISKPPNREDLLKLIDRYLVNCE